MTSSSDQDGNDQRTERLISSLGDSALPPDSALLQELRDRSTAVFEARFQASAQLPERRSKMIVLLTRMLSAAAAAVVVATAWFFARPDGESGPALEVVLAKLDKADSVHLQLVRDGQTSDIFARKPGQLRWNSPDGSYRIDDGSQLWQVDEQANQAVAQASQFFRADRSGPDWLRLAGFTDRRDQQLLLKQQPVERVTTDGVLCDVYRWPVSAVEGDQQVEAIAAASDATLRSLEIGTIRSGRLRPVCRLVVTAIDQPVDDQLFRIADTLTVDGRIGKVLDSQGLVSIRPVNHSRWTPLEPGLVLKPGDFVRCDLRGANATTLRLVKHTLLTLGPGTLVELVSPKEFKVVSGEVKAIADTDAPVTLIGANNERLELRGTQMIRLQAEKLIKLEKESAWVAGFEGATAKEAIGSLVAKIDGRDVPLTVGTHKVTVDIRDQIARTVIEESFVNHTPSQLEGVFYFPLPQDASISGFGMWIGNELVEADIVEKQRAREIYETILREKRDPGLLEWTGGNLFKARIFPILAHSQKRIKITYTQVLPLQGNQYRYSYSLQSELLKQHPLSELAIAVTINSQVPLTTVTSPTHTGRISQTDHAARVEFSAQEYSPDRDFEVVVQLQSQPSAAVMIPHQRGEDGYFMLQVMPPAPAVAQDREVLPDGDPLELLLVADTSASMDEQSRGTQAELVSAILSSLSPQDAFNLMMCDVECHWLFDEPVPADAGSIESAISALSERISLGWTDLDKAFHAALQRTGRKTQVIYIGDGIITTGDADPVAFAKRLRQLYQGHPGTAHAVAVSSSFESVVLKAIASLGPGSLRRVTADQGVQKVARDMLAEITQPVTRISKVEFRGLRTARVYPEEFPNLPDGTQQILLGRYLPDRQDVQGEVVITALRGDTPLQITSPFELNNAEQGNSFIPRLWARMHLDALLEQGSSQAIQDEIINLSEEYHIITPYTSLLVLESDADRERFQVKRRFQMRDGERFFAAGRGNANYEMLQQQMRRAGDWRIRLRMAVLRELAGLGREPFWQRGTFAAGRRAVVAGRPIGGPVFLGFAPRGSFIADGSSVSQPMSATWGEDELGLESGYLFDHLRGYQDEYDLTPMSRERLATEIDDVGDFVRTDVFSDFGGEDMSGLAHNWRDYVADEDWSRRLPARPSSLSSPQKPSEPADEWYTRFNAFAAEPSVAGALEKRVQLWDVDGDRLGSVGGGSVAYGAYFRSRQIQPPGANWLNTLFPQLPPAPSQVVPQRRESNWPDDARRLSESLLRKEQLTAPPKPLEIVRTAKYFDVRWDNLTSQQQATYLLSADAWLLKTEGNGSQTLVQECDRENRSLFSQAFQLGRTRVATAEQLRDPPLDLSGYVVSPLEEAYRDYQVELTSQGDSLVLLIARHPTNVNYELHFLIDTQKKVLVQTENWQEGKVTSVQKFSGFVQVAGAWWATQSESFDDQKRRTTLITEEMSELDDEKFTQRLKEEQVGKELVQWVHEPLPSLPEASKAVADTKGQFEDHLVVLLHFARIQKWDRVLQQLEAMENVAGEKPGVKWLRDGVLQDARRREELRLRILDRAASIAQPTVRGPATQEYFLANHLISQARSICEANEMLAILDTIEPVFRRQAEYLQAEKHWRLRRADFLDQAGRSDEALALRRQLALDHPHDNDLQRAYAQALINTGDYDVAAAWIAQALSPEAKWYPHEEESLRNVVTQMYRSQGRYPQLVEYLALWVDCDPETTTAYQQYLTALIKNDQIESANEMIARWLEAGKKSEELSKSAPARLQAAAMQAVGQGYDLNTNRLDEQWLDPLSEVVLAYVGSADPRDSSRVNTVDQIMNSHLFRQTDQCRRVRSDIAQIVKRNLDTLSFDRLQRLVNWIWSEGPAVEPELWKSIIEQVTRRWETESIAEHKQQVGTLLGRLLSGKSDTQSYFEFLRRQLREGPQRYRDQYAETLFNSLLQQPWSQETEDEAASLVVELSPSAEPFERLFRQVAAICQLTDAMVTARYRALMSEVKNPSELSRTELRELQAANLRQARREYALQLDQRRRTAAEELVGWMNVEWIYLQVQLEENLDQVVERCWEFLGSESAPLDAEQPIEQLETMLLRRYLTVLANVAARRNAKPELSERLLQYIDKAIVQLPDGSAPWRLYKYQLLIALDQPTQLIELLGEWIKKDDALIDQWRLALGYLLAEQGDIKKAITQFEQLKENDALSGTDLRALADWYLVVDEREKYEESLRSALEMTGESALRKWLGNQLGMLQGQESRGTYTDPFGMPSSSNAGPGELDENVIRVFLVLFAKSTDPSRYLHTLRAFYRQTHDFRLLAALADSVVGHTAGEVYPLLSGMRDTLTEIRDEATCDSLVERLPQVRQATNSVVDQRAVDLLELLVERRAAELINQPGPHADKALAAMQRAFDRQWTSGEPRLMADLLANLGRIAVEPMAAEQLRQLKALLQQASAGTSDRLYIAWNLAQTHWCYGRGDDAIDLLESALQEYQAACGGVLLAMANGPLNSYVDYLANKGRFARAETVLQDQLTHPVNAQQSLWLTRQLYQLYEQAVRDDGEVSLGQGTALYQALTRQLQSELEHPDPNHRRQLMDRLISLYRTAKEKKIGSATTDIVAFARDRFPAVMKQQVNDYQSTIGRTAQAIYEVAGPREGLAFLIASIQNEPRWFAFTRQDGWNEHWYRLAQWRKEIPELGDLEEPLLAIVTKELRRDLESRESRNRVIYWQHHAHFWEAQSAAFLRTAETVYAQRKTSGEAVKYIAEYLANGLGNFPRAIEMLSAAVRDAILDTNGQFQLADYLHHEQRFEESVPVLEPLVERVPENMEYRTHLMHAYFQTGRQRKLLQLLEQTDGYFHQSNRWTDDSISRLAASCLENRLFEQSVKYYTELIPLHKRSQPRRGAGDGTLSAYCQSLARAYAGLGKTAEAVDAASEAIVCWGPQQQQRRDALESLKRVLRESHDLDAYVGQLDQEVSQTGLDKPIVRQAMAVVFMEKQQYAKAVAQLELATTLQANDVEAHKNLIQCYDRQGDAQAAIKQCLVLLRLTPRDIEAYKALGRRFEGVGQSENVERTYTSIVEVLPHEAEGHTMLAQIRQEQGRWEDATAHWQQVATLRSREPTGWLGLARAQLHLQQWKAARQTIDKLKSRSWPDRFSNVPAEVNQLERAVEEGRARK